MQRVELTTNRGERIQVELEGLVRGGEACVYSGVSVEGRVAVKVANHPLPDGAWLFDEADVLERLAADPAARVVRVRDRGLWGGRPFLVEDWVPLTLERVVRRGDALPRRLWLCIELAEAVASLHAQEPPVLHRDIKPSNALVHGERVLLADFGVARPLSTDATRHTAVPHTPGFCPPELRGAGPHRTSLAHDCYGLAATVVFALLGRAPASRGARVELAELRLRVRGSRAHRCLASMLAEDPAARHGTAAELAAALRTARPARPWLPLFAVAGAALALGAVLPWGILDDRDATSYPSRRIALAGVQLEVGETELSQALWEAIGGDPLARRREYRNGGLGPTCTKHYMLALVGADLPMVCVDFADAAEAANRLSRASGLPEAYALEHPAGEGVARVVWDRSSTGWRLPTAEEWDAMAELAFPDGRPDAGAGACARVNIGDAALVRFFPTFAQQEGPAPCDDGHAGPAPVRALPPDALGLHHLFGNVHEWVWSDGDAMRGIRGAAFNSSVGQPLARGDVPAVDRRTNVGIRLVREVR